MGDLSNYLENALLDHLFGKASYTQPTIYIGLSSSTPNDDGTGITEPSGGGYARVSTAAADWNAASAGLTDNANVIDFGTATGDWGSALTHWVAFDASSGGNVLCFGALSVLKTVYNGDPVKFPAGDLDFSLD